MVRASGLEIPALQGHRVSCKDKTGIFVGALIQCYCCEEKFAPSAFERHAGGTWHRPWQFIIVEETGKNISHYRTQFYQKDPQTKETKVQVKDEDSFEYLPSKRTRPSTNFYSNQLQDVVEMDTENESRTQKKRKKKSKDKGREDSKQNPMELSYFSSPLSWIENPKSPLSDYNTLKSVISADSYNILSHEEKKSLHPYLAEPDQGANLQDPKSLHKLFNSPALDECMVQYTTLLKEGEFDPNIRPQRVLAREKELEDMDPWQRVRYEEYWAETWKINLHPQVTMNDQDTEFSAHIEIAEELRELEKFGGK